MRKAHCKGTYRRLWLSAFQLLLQTIQPSSKARWTPRCLLRSGWNGSSLLHVSKCARRKYGDTGSKVHRASNSGLAAWRNLKKGKRTLFFFKQFEQTWNVTLLNGLREATKDFGAWNLKVAQHASGIAFVKTINIRANRLSNKFAHGMVAHVPKATEAEVSIKKSQDLQICF